MQTFSSCCYLGSISKTFAASVSCPISQRLITFSLIILFHYHLLHAVTTFCLARDALNMLRDRKDGFDILITDVNMPDMDGFQLLEHVRAEMDLPVISEST